MRRLYGTASSLTPSLQRKRILIVEDEFFVADDLAQEFASVGAKVVGPVSSLSDAFRIAEGTPLDGAILDIKLRGEMVFPLAEKLRERGVSVVFLTGYERWSIPPIYQSIPLCEKPADGEQIAKALFG